MSEKKKIKVLIADDEAHIRALLTKIVTSMGAEVVAEAKNGKEAFELFQSHCPHITLLDINMPIMDGQEALAAIIDSDEEAIVIMLTSLSSMETVKECIEAGAANYIRKDTPLPEIKKFIKETWAEYRPQ